MLWGRIYQSSLDLGQAPADPGNTTQILCMKKLLPISIATLLVPSVYGVVIIDDSFADGDQAKTGALDSDWWTSSSSAGDEISPGVLGLVTGSSGRGIHTTFPAQTLANAGDSLVLTYTFTTPTTVGSGSSSAFRVGVYGTLGRALNAHISASSGTPNPLYGWSVGNGGAGDAGLPGYMLDYDVNTGAGADINFREHNTGSATGRLMATTSGFSNFTSGPDAGYTFDPNTSYTGSITLTRDGSGGIDLTGTIGGSTYTVNDPAPDTYEFGFLGFHANSNQFGSSNSAGNPDNGLDFTNVTVEFNSIPEPSSMGLLLLGGILGMRRRRA